MVTYEEYVLYLQQCVQSKFCIRSITINNKAKMYLQL